MAGPGVDSGRQPEAPGDDVWLTACLADALRWLTWQPNRWQTEQTDTTRLVKNYLQMSSSLFRAFLSKAGYGDLP
jgi:hypothetical protein